MRIKLVGVGGQGIVLAGIILGEAAAHEGYNVIQAQEYSSQSRGGASNANIIISKDPINDFSIDEADILVALSQVEYDKNKHILKNNGLLIVDTDLVTPDKEYFGGSFTKVAYELGSSSVVNMVMLGYLIRKTKMLPEETVEKVLAKRVPKGTEDINRNAFKKGVELAG